MKERRKDSRSESAISTMDDVARVAGVSAATVSRVINHSGYVGGKTRERVERIIKASGFVPSKAARSLTGSRTQLLGLVIPDIGNPVYLDILKGISAACREQGFSVVLGQYGDDELTTRESVLHLASLNVDGIVLFLPEFHRVDPRLYLLPFVSNRIPIVQTGHPIADLRIDAVAERAEQTGRLAGEHLAKAGYERVTVVGSTENPFARERLLGFRKAMRESGIGDRAIRTFDAELTLSGGHDAGVRICAEDPLPDAVFCLNDVTAIGVLQAAREQGIRVPKQLGVMGVDGIQLGTLVHPRLTTVTLPTLEIGRILFNLLHDRISGAHTGEARGILVDGRLCVRESTISSHRLEIPKH